MYRDNMVVQPVSTKRITAASQHLDTLSQTEAEIFDDIVLFALLGDPFL